MPKGRNFAPDGASEGIWFPHLGLPHTYSEPPKRHLDTSTGAMLNTPYKPNLSSPFPPPRGYLLRDSRNFKLANDFSEHNNRHLLQDTGEYFGDGLSRSLGRRLAAEHLRHHTTPGTFLHDEFNSCDTHQGASIYTGSYALPPPLQKMAHRRYPREYTDPDANAPQTTSTTHWYRPPLVPHKTSLQVLASSQEPFLKANEWKYSFHGKPKYYPPYTPITGRRQQTCL